MTNIIASASVPAANRLIDADTADIIAIRRDTNAGRFPTNQPYTGRAAVPVEPSGNLVDLGRQVWELTRSVSRPFSDAQIARQLGIAEADVNDAVTAYLATRPEVAESVKLGRSVDARLNADPQATYADVAADLGVTLDRALDARNDFICWTEGAVRLVETSDRVQPSVDWWDRPVTQQCTVDWCRGDCVLGGPDELGHSRTLVEAQVADGCVVDETRRLLVLLQQSQAPDLPGGFDKPTVYLSTGDTDAYGVNLHLDEAEALAVSLLAGIRAVRAAQAGC